MTPLKLAAAIATITLAIAAPATARTQLSEGEIASLQAAMQSHIDQVSVNGALLELNTKNGKVASLYPAKAHPKIMAVGSYYVLCADFRTEKGKNENVNFYVARDGERYVIFATTFGHDEYLEKMMGMGEAESAN